MKQRPFLYILLCLAGSSLLVLNSCKEDTILDANLVPVGDTVNIISLPDTLTVLTKTIFDDSVATSFSVSGIPIFHAIGNIKSDPFSGETRAGIYLQLIPPTAAYKFPKMPDSAVLILPYSGFSWGDTTMTNAEQMFRVYELTDSLSKDSIYYSFTEKAANKAQELGSASIRYNADGTHRAIKDSVTVNGILRYPHVRIPLPGFAARIYNEAANGTGVSSFADFMRYFKGLYIESDQSFNGNALYYFLLNGSNDFTRANIQFYYTDKTSSNQDTVKYASFFFDQGLNAHYNKIGRKYAMGSVPEKLTASTFTSDSIFIIHNEPGAALDIRIPFVKNLPRQPIIKAELILTQRKDQGDDEVRYWEPDRLFPVGVHTGGGSYTIQDRLPISSVEPLIFIDGRRRDVTINGASYSQYVINIPRELQKAIVEQRDTLHLRINGAAQYPGAYRLIGGGRSPDPNIGLKLKIIYSKI